MAQPTSTHPFFRSPFSRHPETNRRRSTRLDLVIPIILSGRDAKGETFRDETQTATVNLHGAKVSTPREILVGMLVTVENPANGAVEKAVCVRIYVNEPDEAEHFIALQLVRPGNIWGVENPPEDWETVAANLLGRGAPSRRTVMTQPVVATPDAVVPVIESQEVPLEQQAADIADSVLHSLRQQIEALTNAALQDFEARLKQLEVEAASTIESQIKDSLSGAGSMTDAMREDAAEQMAAHAAETVAAAEQDLRNKVAAILAPLTNLTPGGTAKPGVPLTRK